MILFFDGGYASSGDEQAFFEQIREYTGKEEIVSVKICDNMEWERVYRYLEDAKAIVLTASVQLNSVSSNVLAFLEKVEAAVINGESISAKFYAILYTNLYEGLHTSTAMSILKNFCTRANITWGRGLGIGGNSMEPESGETFIWRWLHKKRADFRLKPLHEQALFIKEKIQGTDVYISPDVLSRGTYIRKNNRRNKKIHRANVARTNE